MEEKSKEETKKKHKKEKDQKENRQSAPANAGRPGKKLNAEGQMYQAMLADYQRKQRMLKKQQSPDRSSSDASEDEQQRIPGFYITLLRFEA